MSEPTMLCPKCGRDSTPVIAQDKLKYRGVKGVVVCRACYQRIAEGPAAFERYAGAPDIVDMALDFYSNDDPERGPVVRLTRDDLIDHEPCMITDTEGAGGFYINNAGAGVRLFTRRGMRIFRLSMLDRRVEAGVPA